MTERVSADDAIIRRSSRCEGSVDGSWRRPCESRTSLGNKTQPVEVEFFYCQKSSQPPNTEGEIGAQTEGFILCKEIKEYDTNFPEQWEDQEEQGNKGTKEGTYSVRD
ncbi:hypothetical protein [Lysinibacillus sp. 3P01SB]|uniref:hypothetical protein n=1 Tax=Lysinibacillus sp. 3P01SB TaxID=3132284 RepID=UPI0039A689AA